MPLAAVVREEEVALENRGSELALGSRQANRKSDEGRCILHRDSAGCFLVDVRRKETCNSALRSLQAGSPSKNKERTTHTNVGSP